MNVVPPMFDPTELARLAERERTPPPPASG
jgi:hypothetical protein